MRRPARCANGSTGSHSSTPTAARSCCRPIAVRARTSDDPAHLDQLEPLRRGQSRTHRAPGVGGRGLQARTRSRRGGPPRQAVGGGPPVPPIGAEDGMLLRLDRMNQVLAHDTTTGRVRVQAGISLRELNPQLKALGLALPNLGDVDPQSVAGAVSTGTHGTGGKLFGISAAVVGVQLVMGDGEVLEIDEGHEWFGASRVTLGALGIVTEVTLQCVPAFLLHAREEPMALPEVLDRAEEFT